MEWISVKERMPDEWIPVLWYGPKDGIFQAEWDGGHVRMFGLGVSLDAVTHWMPLPKAPEREE